MMMMIIIIIPPSITILVYIVIYCDFILQTAALKAIISYN